MLFLEASSFFPFLTEKVFFWEAFVWCEGVYKKRNLKMFRENTPRCRCNVECAGILSPLHGNGRTKSCFINVRKKIQNTWTLKWVRIPSDEPPKSPILRQLSTNPLNMYFRRCLRIDDCEWCVCRRQAIAVNNMLSNVSDNIVQAWLDQHPNSFRSEQHNVTHCEYLMNLQFNPNIRLFPIHV